MPCHSQSAQSTAGDIDLALGLHAGSWLRHPVLGDPSFDSFERAAGNPLHRGRAPREWTVNGFLFEDPRGGGLFAYVGRYPAGYACGPGVVRSDCLVLRSRDEGRTWAEVGPVFAGDFAFAGEAIGANNAPDVTVTFADGRYHLVYDWGHDTATWASAFNPQGHDDSGIGYAWSDRPEGPFHRHPVPIFRNRTHRRPVPGKYLRLYASTLLRRQEDWLLLTLTDSGTSFAWGLYALTAKSPDGPWSEPRLVLSLEGDRFHPALMEFFPAFTHEGRVYCPATSVALNRNFQCLWRAPLEQAHEPPAWSMQQHGSLWHAADREEEHYGLWGQTFSGLVRRDGRLWALFPSRDRAVNGTIGLASRPWDQPLRERGFRLGGGAGASLALTRRGWGEFALRGRAAARGIVRLVWGWAGVLGPDRHGSDATLHPMVRTAHRAWEWRPDGWRLLAVDADGREEVLAAGAWTDQASREFTLEVSSDGMLHLTWARQPLWSGPGPAVTGRIGWLVEPHSYLAVDEFVVTGSAQRVWTRWHLYDAFLATGVNAADWLVRDEVAAPGGQVAVSREAGGRLKWNFTGTGVRWWAPRGPELGRVRVKVDGEVRAEIDLGAESSTPAAVVFAAEDLADGHHALVLEPVAGRLATGGLEVAGL